MPNTRFDRRGFLRGTALAGSAALMPLAAAAREYSGSIPWEPGAANPPSPARFGTDRFLTPAERAFLTAAVDRLIPPDDQWPGASGLGVVDFLDDQLSGAYGRGQMWYMQGPWAQGEPTQGYQSRYAPAGLYRAAIRAIDAHTRDAHGGRVFAALPADHQDAVLTGLDDKTIQLDGVDGKTFFDLLLQNTVEGYFGDPVHGGNRDMTAWRMIGFPGARYDYRPFVKRHNERLDLEPVSVAGMTVASIRRREG